MTAHGLSFHRPDTATAEVLDRMQFNIVRTELAELFVLTLAGLMGGIKVGGADQGCFQKPPLAAVVPGFPADKCVTGNEHDGGVQRDAFQETGQQHGTVNAVALRWASDSRGSRVRWVVIPAGAP